MITKEILAKIIICAAMIGSFCGGCTYINHKLGLEDDHFVEESLEAVIEHHTGQDIDLSPSSQED